MLPIATVSSFSIALGMRHVVGAPEWIVEASGISIFILLILPFHRTLTPREVPTRKMLILWALGAAWVFLVAYLFEVL